MRIFKFPQIFVYVKYTSNVAEWFCTSGIIQLTLLIRWRSALLML